MFAASLVWHFPELERIDQHFARRVDQHFARRVDQHFARRVDQHFAHRIDSTGKALVPFTNLVF